MKINIKYTNLDHSQPLHEYVEKKIGGLAKLLKKIETKSETLARVEVARTTKHHHKGVVYRAEVNLDMPNTVLRVAHEDWDIRVAVDQVKDKLQREIVKYKETMKLKI